MKLNIVYILCWSCNLFILLLAPQYVFAQPGGDLSDMAHDCMIEPLVVSEIGSASQGIIAEVLVERGASVKRGQAIAKLDAKIEAALLRQAEARASMQSEIITRKADLHIAELDVERVSELYEQKMVPEQQRDQAFAREQVAKAALLQALENKKLLQIELNRAKAAVEQRTIRSPIDGVVVSLLVSSGELIYDNPIMTVAQLDPLRIEVVLPARLFNSLTVGDQAQIYPELSDDEPLLSHIDVIDPLLDGKSGTFGVSILLPNEDRRILAGQKCRVSFPMSNATDGDSTAQHEKATIADSTFDSKKPAAAQPEDNHTEPEVVEKYRLDPIKPDS